MNVPCGADAAVGCQQHPAAETLRTYIQNPECSAGNHIPRMRWPAQDHPWGAPLESEPLLAAPQNICAWPRLAA